MDARVFGCTAGTYGSIQTDTGSRGFMGSRRLSDPLRAIRDHAGPGLNSTRDGSAWNLRATMSPCANTLFFVRACSCQAINLVVKRSTYGSSCRQR